MSSPVINSFQPQQAHLYIEIFQTTQKKNQPLILYCVWPPRYISLLYPASLQDANSIFCFVFFVLNNRTVVGNCR